MDLFNQGHNKSQFSLKCVGAWLFKRKWVGNTFTWKNEPFYEPFYYDNIMITHVFILLNENLLSFVFFGLFDRASDSA